MSAGPQGGSSAGGGSSPALRPVPLPELRLLAEGRAWQVDQQIAGLDSLTPVRGELRARHHGTVLELESRLSTIVTLCCDRCLGQFNHPLQAEVHELIELRPAGSGAGHDPQARSLASEPPDAADLLDDRLDPQGHFEPETWIFEQLSLRLPLVNRCGPHCPGPDAWSSEPATADPRWSALQGLGGR